MPKATSYRIKIKGPKGRLVTAGKAKTPTGLKSAFSRARAKHAGPITVVRPDGGKHVFGSEVKKLTGKE